VARPTVLDSLLGHKVGGVRATPITLKIVGIFIVFLLLSNLITNYINLTFNRSELIRLTTSSLVRDLKDIYLFSSNQFKMYRDTKKEKELFLSQVRDYARLQFKAKKSVSLGVDKSGQLLFVAGPGDSSSAFEDKAALLAFQTASAQGVEDGSVDFTWNGENYFGIYRFSADWNCYLVRGEEWNEFYEPTVSIFTRVALIILAFTLVSAVFGALLLSYILRFVGRITKSIMEMQRDQKMAEVDVKGAPNDEVTYLGLAMNNLSSTIQNLVEMFKKFVARDVAAQAYSDGEIRLVGSKRNLAIMFSDIKGFTFMTETLGNEIIELLNKHYSKAIRVIHERNGDVGSIIGDAILAVFGTMTKAGENKSIEAVAAGYQILVVAEELRKGMEKRKADLEKAEGRMEEPAVKVYEAVLLEIGVGIDGGEVFYGNIGSNERMVNTVIGDNVNSSSRLEGLTRVYKVPMIVSAYIRDEVLVGTSAYVFQELDTVQVKGKTIGKRIYFPLEKSTVTAHLQKQLDLYSEALEMYYRGDWPAARLRFARCELPSASVFVERITNREVPGDWNGIWTMKDK